MRSPLRLVPVVLVLSCGSKAPPTATSSASAAASTGDVASTVTAALDTTVDPCDDFYQYACGGWLKTTEIPGDQADWFRSFSTIEESNRDLVRQILEDAAAKKPSPIQGDPDWDKVGTYYGACMDEKGIEQRGAEPLQPMLAEIAATKDLPAVMAVAADLQMAGGDPLFSAGVEGDRKDPTKDILYLSQGGLGLPDRDYYLKTGSDADKLRADYQKTMSKLLSLAGDKQADDDAKKAYDLEMELAKISKPQDELRDPVATYHKIDAKGLTELAPNLSWPVVAKASGIADKTDLSVEDTEYFKQLDALLAKTPLDALQAYLKWNLVRSNAGRLSKAFVDTSFAFYGTELSGQKQQRERWKRCTQSAEGAFGEAIGRYYVAKAFPGDSKQISKEMIDGIEGAFASNLPNLDWMDEATRGKALEKMQQINNKIGYPDKWRDYSSLTVEPGKFYENAIAASTFESKRQLGKIGGPVDRSEWGMIPPEVNAYYDPSLNEIAFPAGILQAPFFDRRYPPAMNYGAIGMVMGHELTHGFDDEGRQFDGQGQMVEWWAPEVSGKFDQRAQCVVDQYSAYEVQPGLKVNGKLTLGENIADLGGVKEAYHAWKDLEAKRGATPSPVPGMSSDQLFFVGFAQGWCAEVSPQLEQMLVTVDPHSPAKYRVNGPLQDFPEFAQAFQCKDGAPMNPTNKCVVW